MTTRDSDFCMKRRSVLQVAGGTTFVATFGLPDLVEGAQGGSALHEGVYPELTVAKLSQLEEGQPVAFAYPLKQQPNMLVKLGTRAQGGVGPGEDVVAYSVLCTHMGGSLRGRYRHDTKAIGPCPFHFSTFDLRKGGIPVHASATQKLPQIVLRVDGDDVVAVGVKGLVYGFRNNLADGELAHGTRPGSSTAPVIMRG